MKIVLENIHKSYGKRNVVSRVNLSVAQGEIVGLLGPNGAGKTTTFYIATGLEKPNQGTVWLNDLDITKLAMHQRAAFGNWLSGSRSKHFPQHERARQHFVSPRTNSSAALGMERSSGFPIARISLRKNSIQFGNSNLGGRKAAD